MVTHLFFLRETEFRVEWELQILIVGTFSMTSLLEIEDAVEFWLCTQNDLTDLGGLVRLPIL